MYYSLTALKQKLIIDYIIGTLVQYLFIAHLFWCKETEWAGEHVDSV